MRKNRKESITIFLSCVFAVGLSALLYFTVFNNGKVNLEKSEEIKLGAISGCETETTSYGEWSGGSWGSWENGTASGCQTASPSSSTSGTVYYQCEVDTSSVCLSRTGVTSIPCSRTKKWTRTSSQVCIKCKAGYKSSGTSCSSCSPGQYSSAGSSSCSTCGYNKYSSSYASPSCSDCPTGYSSSQGSTSKSACTITAPPGYYIKVADGGIESCPGGTYTSTSTTVAAGNTSTCTTCPAGSYCTGGSNITTCPRGYTTSGTGSTSASDCSVAISVTCSAGQYLASGAISCSTCLKGSYCPGGTFTYSSTVNKGITSCGSGYTTSGTGSTSASQCISTSPTTCPAGQYLGSDDDCYYCEVGKYKTSTGTGSCTPCPAGYTTSGTGSTSASDCSVAISVTCPAGQYLASGATSCSTCLKGSYCPGGTFTYSSTANKGITSCGSGYTTSGTGSTSASQCISTSTSPTTCPAGQYLGSDDDCYYCEVGKYKSSEGIGPCTSCPTGYTTSGTGKTSLSDCIPSQCSVSALRVNCTMGSTTSTYTCTASYEPSSETGGTFEWRISPGTYTGTGKSITVTPDPNVTEVDVSVSYCGKTAQTGITPTPSEVKVEKVSLNKSNVELKVGKTDTLYESITPVNASNKGVTWKSSNTNIVTVNGGVITGIRAGTATITVTTDGADENGNKKTATCSVTVVENDTCNVTANTTSKIVSPTSNGTSDSNSYYTVTVTVSGSDCLNRRLTYYTNNGTLSKSGETITNTDSIYYFNVFPTTVCVDSYAKATLDNGRYSTTSTVQTSTDWHSTTGICEKNPSYTEFLVADRAGANVYYSDYDSATGCYTTRWTRGCGSSTVVESLACYSNGTNYVWTTESDAPSGYSKISSITTEGACKKPSTPVASYACYVNGSNYVWATSAPSGYTKVTGITTKSGCVPACYRNADGTIYVWTAPAPSGYTQVTTVTSESLCKPEEAACYLYNGNYYWGKYQNTVGYIKQTAIKEETYCVKPSDNPQAACYKNDSTGDYLWTDVGPSGYNRVSDIATPNECTGPETPACYLYNNNYVWGSYSKVTGYSLISSVLEAGDCNKPNSACYIGDDGKYVWGDYSLDAYYTLIKDITTKNACLPIDVPKTDLDTAKMIYIGMSVLLAFGIGFVYYVNYNKKKNK